MPQVFDYDLNKSESYFAGARTDWIDQLPTSRTATLLELGCGFGGTGAYALQQSKCSRYVGIEIAPAAAAKARERITEVIVGDVERTHIDLPHASFDGLLMSEVLEHLTDPWSVLDTLLACVKPGGWVFASSPNVAHISIVKQLVRGRWDLTQSGAMDRTHLRWFTPDTYREMFEAAGVEVLSVEPLDKNRTARQRLFSALTLGRYSHLFAYQINLKGRKGR